MVGPGKATDENLTSENWELILVGYMMRDLKNDTEKISRMSAIRSARQIQGMHSFCNQIVMKS